MKSRVRATSPAAIALAALLLVIPVPATTAEKSPAGNAAAPRPATPGLTATARPDLAVISMTPKAIPYQRPDGTNCIDYRPGTVIVSNIGKVRATGFGIGVYWNLGGGPFDLHSPLDNKSLEAGGSMTLVLENAIYALLWCPGSPLPAWQVRADYGNVITEPNEENNLAEKTYQPILSPLKKSRAVPKPGAR